MKKIIFAIILISTIGIVFFILYVPKNVDRNTIVYNNLVTYKDVVYKTVDTDVLTLDILMPTTTVYEKAPMIFYVHDTDLTNGDKSWLTKDIGENVTNRLLDEGYAIISLNYRMLDDATHLPANIVDIKDAIRYIRKSIDDYNLDAYNVGIWGSGMGAYLALTAAYSPSGMFLGANDLKAYSADVDYAIDFYGFTRMELRWDLTSMTSSELDALQNDFNIWYGQDFSVYSIDYETMRTYDPYAYVSNDTIPTIIVHGLTDQVVPIEQSNTLDTKLTTYGIDHQIYRVLGGDNGLGNIVDTEKTNICDAVAAFVKALYVS